jgi:hypothetical protein
VVRARRGSGSVRVGNGRLLAQVSLGTDERTADYLRWWLTV